MAPSGQAPAFPDGFDYPAAGALGWPSEVSAEETDHAERLIRS